MALEDLKKYRPGAGGGNEFTQLLQMLQQSGAREEEKRSRHHSFMLKEFSDGADSFNNEEVQYNLNKLQEYSTENISKMSSYEIDAFNMLKDKYNKQIETNNKFDVDNNRRLSFGKAMYDFADEYSNADASRSFSWQTTYIDNNGKTKVEDNIVDLPNPEDYEGGENNLEFRKAHDKAISDLGGVEAYVEKRREYKRYLKNEAQKQIGAYGDYQEKMIQDYGGSGRLNQFHLREFAELDESYGFIIDSLEDDGLFDADERDAYKSAIAQKSSNPIRQFIKRDEELKDSNRTQLLKEMQYLKAQGDSYEEDMNAASLAALDMSEAELQQEAITIPKNTQYNTGSVDVSYTYEELKNLGNNPELAGYVSSLNTNLEKIKKDLKNKDSAYMKNDGGSFLAGMEEETWSSGLHEEPEGYIPIVYGKQQINITKPVVSPSKAQPGSIQYKQQQQQAQLQQQKQQPTSVEISDEQELKKKYYSSAGGVSIPEPDFNISISFTGNVRGDKENKAKADKIYNDIKETGIDNIKQSITKIWEDYASGPYLDLKRDKEWLQKQGKKIFPNKEIAQLNQLLNKIENLPKDSMALSKLKSHAVKKYNEIMEVVELYTYRKFAGK